MQATVDIISRAVEASLDRRIVRRLTVAPSIDSEGDAALDVVIVLNRPDLTGGEAVDILVNVGDALLAAGDERFPIISYATEAELVLDDDPAA